MTEALTNNRLSSIVDRLERIAEEKTAARDAFNDVLKEASADGFDQGALRRLIRYRAKDPAKRQEEESIDELYRAQVGEV